MKKISVMSDVLNAALRKLLTGLWIQEFVPSDSQNTQYQVAFEDLKNFSWA